jgi:hypothetical protein
LDIDIKTKELSMYAHHNSHFWGLFSHPKAEWNLIRNETSDLLKFAYVRLFYYALIPSLAFFIGLSVFGRSFSGERFHEVSWSTSIPMMATFYLAIIACTLFMAFITYRVENYFGTEASFENCFLFITYTATPMYIAGLVGLIPIVWLNMLVLMSAVGFSLHLLHIGIPIYMRIPEGKAIVVSMAIITAGLCTLVLFISATAFIWLWAN